MIANLPEGIITPLITPFKENGEVDFEMTKALVRFNMEACVQGLFILGSAGQGPVMNPDERRMFLETVMEVVEEKMPVIAHVGTADSYTGRELARHAKQVGVNSIAIVPPYYYSDHTPYEVIAHYYEIAEGAVDLPIVVYDNPRYTGIPMTPKVVEELHKELPQVLGIKPAFSGLEQMLGYMKLIPEIKVYSASTEYLASGVPLGIAGTVNPPMSFFPEICLEVWEALEQKKYAEAFTLQEKVNAIRTVVSKYLAQYGRGIFKEIMHLRGFDVKRYPRWTTHAFSPEEKQKIYQELKSVGADVYFAIGQQ